MTSPEPPDVHAEALIKGHLGVKTDTTPNDNYTVAGVLAGLPVPPVHPVADYLEATEQR